MGDSAAGEGGNQLFMLLTIVAPGFRQRGHKGVVVKAGDDQILQQMADPLATGIKPEAQPADVSASLATMARRISGPVVLTGSVPAPNAGFPRR